MQILAFLYTCVLYLTLKLPCSLNNHFYDTDTFTVVTIARQVHYLKMCKMNTNDNNN